MNTISIIVQRAARRWAEKRKEKDFTKQETVEDMEKQEVQIEQETEQNRTNRNSEERSYPEISKGCVTAPSLSSRHFTAKGYTKKSSENLAARRILFQKKGGYLLSHGCAVPSALAGLTALFGMGRGGTPLL